MLAHAEKPNMFYTSTLKNMLDPVGKTDTPRGTPKSPAITYDRLHVDKMSVVGEPACCGDRVKVRVASSGCRSKRLLHS